MVCCGTTGQVIPALFAAVHDEPVSHTVTIEACIAADLVRYVLEAHLMSNLQGKKACIVYYVNLQLHITRDQSTNQHQTGFLFPFQGDIMDTPQIQ